MNVLFLLLQQHRRPKSRKHIHRTDSERPIGYHNHKPDISIIQTQLYSTTHRQGRHLGGGQCWVFAPDFEK